MMKWEYVTLPMVAAGFEDPDEIDNYQTILNQYGAQGWELVSAVAYPGKAIAGEIIVLIFKRPRA